MFVLVIGGGKVGSYLSSLLLSEAHKVIVIEARAEHVADLKADLPAELIIFGSGTEPELLVRAGILNADVVAAVTGSDETNLVITNLARLEFGVSRTIARVNNPKNAWMFTPEMGVDVALNQADLMAHLIREEMSLGNMMTLLKMQYGQYSLVEEMVNPGAAVAGKLINELDLPSECLLTAIIRNDKLILPRGGVTLQAEDKIIALAHAEHIDQLRAVLEKKADE